MVIESPKATPLSPRNSTRKRGLAKGHHLKSQTSKLPEKGQTKLPDFFPTQSRRSQRRLNQALAEKNQKLLVQQILDGVEDDLKETKFKDKGRGVVAKKKFNRGDFVVEYSGKLISIAEAKENEAKYGEDMNIGCYMYYFRFKNRQYCIDATEETGRLGRLVNHSRSNGNCATKVVEVQNQPRLILVAKRDIDAGEEILYDYGDRRKSIIRHHPWLIH